MGKEFGGIAACANTQIKAILRAHSLKVHLFHPECTAATALCTGSAIKTGTQSAICNASATFSARVQSASPFDWFHLPELSSMI
jgi:hypothetical protein